MQNKINILGVNISEVTNDNVFDVIDDLLNERKQIQIVTPNPEHIIQAQKNERFRNVLNKADLAVADGVGIVMAARLESFKLRIKTLFASDKIPYQAALRLYGMTPLGRVTGVDLMGRLIDKAKDRKWKVGLVGASDEVRSDLSEKIGAVDCGGHKKECRIQNEECRTQNTEDRIQKVEDRKQNAECRMKNVKDNAEGEKILKKINESGVEVLFVAYGAPWQEIWIADNLQRIPSVKLAMGVGGAFDFMVGRSSRAPELIRKMGLEWLYRLIKEPWRWRRQLRLLEFGWKVLLG